ncbi:MAG: secretin N-terminal domain-containing protein [Verrucomicrobiota bacterium]
MSRHLIFLTAFLITCLPLFSQDAEVPAIPGAVPGAAPEIANPPANNDTLIKESIDFIECDGIRLAQLHTKYTGRRVIVSSAAAKASFALFIDATPQNPLTFAQAAELIKKSATLENFIFVPDATDPNLDFLTITPLRIGVAVFTENDPLPSGDAVITYVMKLDHIKPDEAVRTFTQIVGQLGAFGSIAAVPNAASVIITENTSLIRKLIDIKAQIDKPSTLVATRFINVKFADVTELATTLNEMLGNQQQTNLTGGVQRAPQISNGELPIPNVNTDPGGTSSGEQTPVQIIPDARTNRIVAIGRPVDLLFIEGLISQFDIESDQRNFLRRKLEFLAVADFLPIAGDALTRAFSGTGTGGGDAANPSQPGGAGGGTNRQQGNNFSNNGGRNSSNASLGGLGGSGGSGGSGGGGSRSDSLEDPNVNSAPVSLLVGRTLLVADNITNSIIVQGPPSSVEIIEKLLDQVDVKADQVMISTVFGQLSLGNSTSTGVDWIRAFRKNDNRGAGFSNIGGGNATNVDPAGLINPITGTVAGTFPNQTGLSIYGKIGDSLAAYINLLSSSNDFTVLSRPSIFTANNRKGTISSGRRIAIPTNSNQFGSGGVSTNIEYRDVVLKLEVIPLVNSDDEITLQIALLSDDIIGESEPIGDLGSVPIIGTRELLTTVTVPNNQTIVLGGLITSNDTESVTGIPILSDIPGLGRLFSTKTKGVDRDELMIFIQPSIVNSDKSLGAVQLDMDNRYKVSDPARDFADPSVLLPIEDPSTSSKGFSVDVQPASNNHKPKRPIHRN